MLPKNPVLTFKAIEWCLWSCQLETMAKPFSFWEEVCTEIPCDRVLPSATYEAKKYVCCIHTIIIMVYTIIFSSINYTIS